MSNKTTNEYYENVARGFVVGARSIHKAGRNDNVGTSFVPIVIGGNYQTPTAAVQLDVVSTSANDAAGGTGARVIRLEGLASDGSELIEEVTMNGLTTVTSTNSFLRLNAARVKESGTYATQAAGSHVGDITIYTTGSVAAEDVWAKINNVTTFPRGAAQIGAYSVPLGKKAIIKSISIHVDANKVVDAILFHRDNILQTTAPFEAMTADHEFDGVIGFIHDSFDVPMVFDALSDIGFLAKVTTGSAQVSTDMDLIIVDE